MDNSFIGTQPKKNKKKLAYFEKRYASKFKGAQQEDYEKMLAYKLSTMSMEEKLEYEKLKNNFMKNLLLRNDGHGSYLSEGGFAELFLKLASFMNEFGGNDDLLDDLGPRKSYK